MERTAAREIASEGSSYGALLRVWAALLGLTAVLVFASEWQHDLLSVWAMLCITPVKAALVLWYFMRLERERTVIRAMLLVALAALVVFIGLLFLDVSFR